MVMTVTVVVSKVRVSIAVTPPGAWEVTTSVHLLRIVEVIGAGEMVVV